MSSCNLTKLVPDGETLLHRNKIKGFEEATKSDLNSQIRHQPNRKILGVLKFHLWAYQIGAKRIVNKDLKDTSRYRSLLMNTVGEPPVLLDSILIISSANNLKNYVFNKGYFDVQVGYETKSFIKRSTVSYTITEGRVYTIEKIRINSTDRNVYNLVMANADKSGQSSPIAAACPQSSPSCASSAQAAVAGLILKVQVHQTLTKIPPQRAN